MRSRTTTASAQMAAIAMEEIRRSIIEIGIVPPRMTSSRQVRAFRRRGMETATTEELESPLDNRSLYQTS